MKRVIVLGAGMVGAVMARDLSEDSMFSVTVADIDELNLEKASRKGNIKTIKADLSKPVEVKRLVTDFDLVCGALSSLIGFSALRAVIESGNPKSSDPGLRARSYDQSRADCHGQTEFQRWSPATAAAATKTSLLIH